MSFVSLNNKIIIRNQDKWLHKHVLVAGNVQDMMSMQIEAKSIKVYTSWYNHYQLLARELGEQTVQFSLLADDQLVFGCDTIIYFWPKNKMEAQFQLTNLLSLLPLGCNIFVVGKNRSGTRSVQQMLAEWCQLTKIDTAGHCCLYYGQLIKQSCFDINTFWRSYSLDNVVIKTLPGVFSYKGLDKGSKLLLSTFDKPFYGHIADIGCGTGVLSAVLADKGGRVQLTLSDAYAPAIAASYATLLANGIKGDILAGDVYSAITGRYNMIISNPPFHDDINISLKTADKIIRDSIHYLHIGGELRIVANMFLPYPDLLDEVFGNHEELAKNRSFKVYRAIYKP